MMGVMDMFIILRVMMVSQVNTYTKLSAYLQCMYLLYAHSSPVKLSPTIGKGEYFVSNSLLV